MFNTKHHEIDPQHGPLYLAGEHVGPGTYRNVESGREVRLDEPGILPPSFDGSVAAYALAPSTWASLLGSGRKGGEAAGSQAPQQHAARRRFRVSVPTGPGPARSRARRRTRTGAPS